MSKSALIAFLSGVLASALSYAILIATKYPLSESVAKSDQVFAMFSFAICIALTIFFLVRKYGFYLVKSFFYKQIDDIVKKRINEFCDKERSYGVVKVFANMPACISEISKELATANNIAIFVQIGRDILSGKGLFYEDMKANPNAKSIRILHSSIRTPYLSKKKLADRDLTKLAEWQRDLISSEQSGKQLASLYNEGVFESRSHHEGYYFRVFMFDDFCYVQPYIYSSDNAEKAPVFKIKNLGLGSLYDTFKGYFDNKWLEYEPNTYYINDFIKESSPISVAAFIRYDGLFVFSVPERYISKDNIYIQAVGGKVEPNEAYTSALEREVKEEINACIKIQHSRFTTYINEGAIQFSATFHDQPAPYVIYYRDTVEGSRVKWVLLYNVELLTNSIQDLIAKNENKAIVCLSQTLLSRLVDPTEKITIRDIKNARDGSCIMSSMNFSLDTIVKPRGMVSIINMASSPAGMAGAIVN
ncbi:MAG: hypothetical protein RLZZ422_1699 [Pseudomonadota bacterium]